MPTNRFYAKQSLANLGVFIPKFARFLMNDLATFTGPSWTCAFTYSSAAMSPFEVPPNPADMDSLAADNGWRTGILVAGDYAILNSASAANKLQIGICYQGASTLRIIVAPFQGFDTTANQTDMTNSANWLQPRLTTRDYTVPAGLANYNVVADEDRIIFAVEDTITYCFSYWGKMDNVSTGDDNPAVCYTSGNKVYAVNNDGILGQAWNRISTVNDTTELAMYGAGANFANNNDLTSNATNYLKDNASNEYRGMPVYLVSMTAGHIAGIGSLRGVYFNNFNLSGIGKGTLGTKTYAFMCNTSNTSPIIFDWDGSTTI